MTNCLNCNDSPNLLPCGEQGKKLYALDSSEVFYKILCDDKHSNLQALGIPAGSTLEFILERYGDLISNFEFLTAPIIPSIPEITTFAGAFQYLLDKIEALEVQADSLQASLNTTNSNLAALTARVAAIEKPHINDVNALGFTTTDSLQTVIQTIANNVLYTP